MADDYLTLPPANYDGNFSALFCAPELETTQDFAADVVIKLYE